MSDDWENEFEIDEKETYEELFNKWYFKIFWKDTIKEEIKNDFNSK